MTTNDDERGGGTVVEFPRAFLPPSLDAPGAGENDPTASDRVGGQPDAPRIPTGALPGADMGQMGPPLHLTVPGVPVPEAGAEKVEEGLFMPPAPEDPDNPTGREAVALAMALVTAIGIAAARGMWQGAQGLRARAQHRQALADQARAAADKAKAKAAAYSPVAGVRGSKGVSGSAGGGILTKMPSPSRHRSGGAGSGRKGSWGSSPGRDGSGKRSKPARNVEGGANKSGLGRLINAGRGGKPTSTKPGVKKPGATKPSTGTPAVDKPGARKPGGPKPAAAKPGGTNPEATKPTGAKPTNTTDGQPPTKAGDTKPDPKKPTSTKPTSTKPTSTKPTETSGGTPTSAKPDPAAPAGGKGSASDSKRPDTTKPNAKKPTAAEPEEVSDGKPTDATESTGAQSTEAKSTGATESTGADAGPAEPQQSGGPQGSPSPGAGSVPTPRRESEPDPGRKKGHTAQTLPPPPPGVEGMRPPPAAAKSSVDVIVEAEQIDPAERLDQMNPDEVAVATVVDAPEDSPTRASTGSRPVPAAGSTRPTIASAQQEGARHVNTSSGMTTQYADAELTIRDVVDADADMAEEILQGVAEAQSTVNGCDRLLTKLEALQASLVDLKVPGVLQGMVAALMDKTGTVKARAQAIAEKLPAAAEAISVAGSNADMRHGGLADAVRDAGHIRPAERDYHNE